MAQGPQGEPIATHAVPVPKRWRGDKAAFLTVPVPLHARGGTVYLGLAHAMLVYGRIGGPEVVNFDRPVVSLAGSAPNTRARIAVAFVQGGTVYWNDFEGPRTQSFSDDLSHPVVGFNRGGLLIAAGEEGGEVYATQDRRLKRKAELPAFRSKPIAVLPGPRTDQFAIGTADGEITVYELK
jgi:hypothetical protein